MTTRDKEKIRVLFAETMVLVDNEKDYLTGLDDDCEEISIPCLTIKEVKMLLDQLKEKLLKEDEPC